MERSWTLARPSPEAVDFVSGKYVATTTNFANQECQVNYSIIRREGFVFGRRKSVSGGRPASWAMFAGRVTEESAEAVQLRWTELGDSVATRTLTGTIHASGSITGTLVSTQSAQQQFSSLLQLFA